MSLWQRWLNRFAGPADQDLDRELRAHLELEAEEQQQSGMAARGSSLRGPAGPRQRYAHQGGHTRRVGMDIPRNTLARPSLRATHAAEDARVYRCRRDLAGARRRSELIGIQRAERAAPPAFARTGAGPPRPDFPRALREHFLSELSRSSKRQRDSGISGGILVAQPGCARCFNR